MSPTLLIYPLLFHLSLAHFSQCPPSLTPKDLGIVGVWRNSDTREYRISDEDLTSRGLSLLSEGSKTVLLPRETAECPIGLCLLRFNLKKREDGSSLYEENIFGGNSISSDDSFSLLCAKEEGDCGADSPIYSHSRTINGTRVVGYSLSGATRLEGYTRDALPLCYAWTSRSSVISSDSNSSNSCIEMRRVENGKTTYSSESSSGLHSVGTSASLACSSGFVSTGHGLSLCTPQGWYPTNGLGPCLRQPASPISAAFLEGECSMLSDIPHGRLIYSTLPKTSRFGSGTTVSLLCDLGFAPAGDISSTCIDGTWTKALSECFQFSTFKCLPPFPVLNGKISYFFPSQTPFSHGSHLQLACQEGFLLQGRDLITCTAQGWNPPQLGVCTQHRSRSKRQSVQCPILSLVPGGKISYTLPMTPTAQGSTAVLVCAEGTVPHGSLSTVCLNGQWTNTLGTCGSSAAAASTSGTNCLIIPPIINGRISYSLGEVNGAFPPGTTATPYCLQSYNLYGSTVATCLPTGQWTTMTLGNCGPGLPNECTEYTAASTVINYNLPTGRTGYRRESTIGTLSCSSPGQPDGNVVSTCVAGKWSPPFGQCVIPRQKCTSLTTPIGGSLQYSNGMVEGPFPSGTLVKLTCGNGGLKGSAIVECRDGDWSSEGGDSIGNCGVSKADFAGGNGLGSGDSFSGSTSTTPSSGSQTWGSGAGDTRSMGGDGDLVGAGVVSSGSSSSCLPPIIPIGGTLSYSTPSNLGTYNAGSVVSLICPGSSPVGSSQSQCSNGLWQPLIGRCAQPGESGYLGGGGGGAINPLNNGGLNNGVNNFNNGFGSTTPSPIVGINGQPFNAVNGFQGGVVGGGGLAGASCNLNSIGATTAGMGVFPSGTTLTLQCPLGSSVAGAVVATCINGQWSQMGTCTQPGLSSCTMAPLVLNGQTQYSAAPPYPIGSYARLVCNPGFSLYGVATLTCISGIWSPQSFGQCTLGGVAQPGVLGGGGGAIIPQQTTQTPFITTTQPFLPTTTQPLFGRDCLVPPLTPLQGSLKYSTGNVVGPWNEGVIVALICSNGYHVSGSGAASCRAGSFQPAQLGTCSSSIGASRLPCAAPLTPINGQFNFSSAPLPTGGYPDGAMVALFCQQSTVPHISTCSNANWSPLIPVSCIGLQRDSPSSSALSRESSPSSPSSSSLDCPSLRAPPFGEITFSHPSASSRFPSSTRAVLVCTAGSSLEGNSESHCIEGVFSPPLGMCI